MKTKIKFPFVDSFGDYHDIDDKLSSLNEVFTDRIKAKEIAYDGTYWGVFYVGKLPSKDRLKKMVVAAGWCDKYEHSNFLGENPHFA